VNADERLFLTINRLSHHSHLLDSIMAWSAQWIPVLLAAVLLATWLWKRRAADHPSFRAALAGAVALGCAPIVGLLHHQAQPSALGLGRTLIAHVSGNSFPSEHTALSFGVAVSLLLSGSGLWPVALALAFLVGFARIFVGVHFPLDVLIGAALGTLVALLLDLGRTGIDRAADWVYGVECRVLPGVFKASPPPAEPVREGNRALVEVPSDQLADVGARGDHDHGDQDALGRLDDEVLPGPPGDGVTREREKDTPSEDRRDDGLGGGQGQDDRDEA